MGNDDWERVDFYGFRQQFLGSPRNFSIQDKLFQQAKSTQVMNSQNNVQDSLRKEETI